MNSAVNRVQGTEDGDGRGEQWCVLCAVIISYDMITFWRTFLENEEGERTRRREVRTYFQEHSSVFSNIVPLYSVLLYLPFCSVMFYSVCWNNLI